VQGSDRLRTLAQLADAAGARILAAEAEARAERLREGRFYVVCVGQFKRGKSTLLNALVGEPVLPTGVIPITAAVTVVRHGERLTARVRFGERDWEECEPRALATYVSEEQNPGNEKGVTGVEVFVPSALLESGMCLVDTPGIGSVSEANTAATRAFVPHIDAALVVLGGEPPISGDEMALVQEVGRQVHDLVFVLNKADRQSDAERQEAIAFTERVLAERLGRPVGPILRVSAADRIVGAGPPRDWDRLVDALQSLAKESGADLVRAAERRGITLLAQRLLRELDEQRAALVRPIEESESRVEALRSAVADAERSLVDLGYLLTAEQERLGRQFTEERDQFFNAALPQARRELVDAIRAESAAAELRERAIDLAIEVTQRWLDRWRREQEPKAQALYREAMKRFVDVVNGFQARLATIPGLEGLPHLRPDEGFRTTSRLYYTRMLTVAPSSAGSALLDLLRSRAGRRGAIERAASQYLDRLLEVNSARIKNDFVERVLESRRRLEAELRGRLRELADSAEQALARARETRAAGATAVEAKVKSIAALRWQVEQLNLQGGA
jgi:GTPase SAR1 family protein